jgi:(4-(4-[2-(gamma-L-glutamylamino)ethyl]phenoxymethyl)furan-2-yl)methanamine synthase
MLNTKYKIGWDIGGAHLKAALIDANGVALKVYQLACPLWRGLHELERAITEMRQLLQVSEALSLVTMTGELVDLFPNRQTGVCEIAKVVNKLLGQHVIFYGATAGWINFNNVASQTHAIASMNWHASAQYVAQSVDKGLFIDIGSTTTDMIPVEKTPLASIGQTDAQRMANQALIYTGIVRTPLMALGQTIHFKAKSYYLAAEYFATTADVYRMLQLLPIDVDLADTADGKGKTLPETARRLARMVGHDAEDCAMSDWVDLAQSFKQLQKNILMHAIQTHTYNNSMPIVAAGIGAFLCKELADELGLPCVNVAEYVAAADSQTHQQAVNCFPAYAVARLAL